MPRLGIVVVVAACLSACTFDPPFVEPDASATDAEPPRDAAEPSPDSGPAQDAGAHDAAPSPTDAAPADATGVDAAQLDAGTPDTGLEPDAGTPDTGVFTVCGNGIVEPGEDCDDTNNMSGDGCDSCSIENGYVCVLSPSRCVLETAVRRVDPGAAECGDGDGQDTGNVDCTIADAVGQSPRPQLVLVETATYAEALDFDGGNAIMLVAPTGAVLTSDDGLTLHVRGMANVLLSGFQITGTGAGGGIKAENRGTRLTLLDNVIGPSAVLGLESKSDSVVFMRGNVVRNNGGGGIYLDSNSGYDVANNVVVSNGPGAELGGVRIKKTDPTANFVNNSVASNSASDQPGGIRCEVDVPMTNLVVWANAGLGTTGISDRCLAQYSLLQDTDLGTGNISQDPSFSDPLLRLNAGSPAVDAGDPAGVVPTGPAPRVDFDRRRRPPATVDMGAFERP